MVIKKDHHFVTGLLLHVYPKGATVRETLLPPFIADIFGDDLKKIESDPVMVAVLEAGVSLK